MENIVDNVIETAISEILSSILTNLLLYNLVWNSLETSRSFIISKWNLIQVEEIILGQTEAIISHLAVCRNRSAGGLDTGNVIATFYPKAQQRRIGSLLRFCSWQCRFESSCRCNSNTDSYPKLAHTKKNSRGITILCGKWCAITNDECLAAAPSADRLGSCQCHSLDGSKTTVCIFASNPSTQSYKFSSNPFIIPLFVLCRPPCLCIRNEVPQQGFNSITFPWYYG